MNEVNILLVDDEKDFIDTMSKRLKQRDLSVSKAFSGEEALTFLSSHPETEVVILDVKMPGMDGSQTLREIKRLYPLIEVIMLTGHASVRSGIEAMKLGAADYLTKPCDIDHLLAKVDEAANKKRRHEEKIMEARLQELSIRRP